MREDDKRFLKLFHDTCAALLPPRQKLDDAKPSPKLEGKVKAFTD